MALKVTQLQVESEDPVEMAKLLKNWKTYRTWGNTMSDLSGRVAKLSKEARIELEKKLLEKKVDTIPTFSIHRRSMPDAFPLSFAQQRLWFFEEWQPGSPLYNVSKAVYLVGNLNISALEKSVSEIVNRHAALRATFSKKDGYPIQEIAPLEQFFLIKNDLTALPDIEREEEARQIAVAESRRPFDLEHGPLLRATLLILGETEYQLLLTMHHIASDGWSMGVLVEELATLYDAFINDRPSPLPDLPIQYADYAQWQRDWLQGEVLEQQLNYWKKQLADAPELLALPTDHPRPAVQTDQGATYSFTLSSELTDQLKELSQQEGVTLFMTLLAAFQVLLYRYSNQTDIVVGSPIANRTHAEIERLIGFFVNTLVLRTDLSGNPSFRELLKRVREVTLAAYAHQDLPFEKLVEELNPKRDLSHSPLFQVMFVLQNAPMPPFLRPLICLLALHQLIMEQHILTLYSTCLKLHKGLKVLWNMIQIFFNLPFVISMVDHFKILLESIIEDPGSCILNLNIPF